jgi:predicted Zn-dependent peptidase
LRHTAGYEALASASGEKEKMLSTDILRSIEKSWKFVTLSNGIKVVHLPVDHDHRLFLSATFAVGSRDENSSQAGISHFLEHMMFRGSKNYPSFLALADAFEWLGGHWNAETGQEHTEYTYAGISKTTAETIKLFSEFLSFPKLLDIEIEREVILREIEDEMNEFDQSTDLDWHTSNLIWPTTGLGNPIAGTLKSVRKITQQHLVKHRQDWYTSDRCAIYVAGGGDSDKVFSCVEEHFGGYPLVNPSKPAPRVEPEQFAGPKFRFVENSDNQYHLSLAFLCEGDWSPKDVGYEMICRILSDSFSSRLSLRLREELGLVYDVSCDECLVSDCGTIVIEAQVTPDKVGVVLKEVCKILTEFRSAGPTDDELKKAMFRAEVRLSLAAYEPEQLGFRLAWNFLHNKPSSLQSKLDAIRKQHTSGITELAAEVFRQQNCAIVVMGPKNSGLDDKVQEVIKKYL